MLHLMFRRSILTGTWVPEIMIPLVDEVKELKYVKDVVVATADQIIAASGHKDEI